MSKLIGVAARMLTEKGVKKLFVNLSYIEALESIGVVPVLLTSIANIDEVMAGCDGFLLPGGADVDPHRYGENDDGSKDVDERIDDIDEKVVRYALYSRKPLLGICRGIQSLNVFAGGTLYQNIPGHSRIEEGHEVEVFDSRLLSLSGKIIVNSYHHQAVNIVAPGFKVTARSNDGTIEAIEHESLPVFAVQWHPEKLPDSPYSKAVFNSFKALLEKE